MAKKTGISLNRRILLVILGIAVSSQIVFLYVNVSAFRQGYLQVVSSNMETVGASLQTRLNRVVEKGIPLTSLVGLKPLLRKALSDVDELQRVSIVSAKGKFLYSCTRTTFFDGQSIKPSSKALHGVATASTGQVRLPLSDGSGEVVGSLVLEPARKIIGTRIRDIVLDSATIILISILAIVDLLFFMVAYNVGLPVTTAARDIEIAQEKAIIDYPVRRTKIDFLDHLLDVFDSVRFDMKDRWIQLQALGRSITAGKTDPDPVWKELLESLGRMSVMSGRKAAYPMILSPVLIRPVIFLSVFAEALALSFLPLYARQIYHPLLGLPQQIVIGLPIAVYMFCFALSLPITGAWTDLFGRRRLYLVGAIASAVGLGICGLANGIIPLIVARGIVGIGNGTVFMAAQGYVLDTTNSGNRAEGLAIHLTAFYSGTMCGIALGSMLADRLGYRALFFLGAGVALAAVIFLYMFVVEPQRSTAAADSPGQSAGQRMKAALPKFRHLKELMADRNFAAISLLQAMPNKICLIGLVSFAAPILLKAEGVGQSDIGRIVAIYSLLMVLLSQVVSRWSDRFANTKNFIFLGGLTSGLAFLPFFFITGPWVVMGVITILGLAHSLTVSNQTKLASRLKSVEKVGLGPGLGMYRQMERLGNVLATLVIGALAANIGFAKALGVSGAVLVAASLLFGFLFKEESEQ